MWIVDHGAEHPPCAALPDSIAPPRPACARRLNSNRSGLLYGPVAQIAGDDSDGDRFRRAVGSAQHARCQRLPHLAPIDDGLGVGSSGHRLAAELLDQVKLSEARLGRRAIRSNGEHQRALGLGQLDVGVWLRVVLLGVSKLVSKYTLPQT